MKLTKFETEILKKAAENQGKEHRTAPFWRAAVKIPLPNPVQEIDSEPVHPWLYDDFQEPSRINNGIFITQVKSILGDDIQPGRTSYMPNVFHEIGFLFAASSPRWSRAGAEALIKEWKNKAPQLDYFILPEFEPGADLFAAEVVGAQPGQENMYQHRRPMIISSDVSATALEEYEKAVKNLEKKGLVVRVQGQEFTRKWQGVNVTRAGKEFLKTNETTSPKVTPAEKENSLKLKCLSCQGIFHSVTSSFDPEKMPCGEMFRLLPVYQENGWEGFNADAMEDNLVCPQCGTVYVDPENGFIRKGSIVEE